MISPSGSAPRARACSSDSRTTTPAPSPIMKPSRPLSNGREAPSGSSLRVERARIAALDRLPGLANGVAAGGASGDDAEVRALRAKDDGDHAGRQVADRHGDQEGRHAGGALLAHEQDLLGQGPDAADARPDDDAGPFGQLPFQVPGQAGLVHCLVGSHESELDVAVVATLILAIENGRRVEVLDLSRDPGRQARWIELGDGADTGLAGNQARPGGWHVVAERAEGAHAGDHYSRHAIGRTHRTSFPVLIVAAR